MDLAWADRARQMFRPHETLLDFTYLVGLPLADLVGRVANLPADSIIYYIHVFQDGDGNVLMPAQVLGQLARVANAPIYGHVDTYVGRGIVGGRVFSFEAAAANAARVALRILSGEKPEAIGVLATGENDYQFDERQLRRWGIGPDRLPPGSAVRNKESTFWDLYKWPVVGVVSLCVAQTLLISALLVQRGNRRRAEEEVRASQRELRDLTGRLLVSQEWERRRIARELHDDLNQSLALLSVDLDLLRQTPPRAGAQFQERVRAMMDCVKQLSSAVHELSHQLHPARLEQLGLVAAVRGLCKELTGGHGLAIEFSAHDVPAAIPAGTALCLYRVVQESLQNVLKHSGARRAGVEIDGFADAIAMRIHDDGKGFTPAEAADKGRLGLISMPERLRLVGGTIVIDSRLAGGTRINVRVPLSSADPDEGLVPADSGGDAIGGPRAEGVL
jgi:signal transduction histidine kinase